MIIAIPQRDCLHEKRKSKRLTRRVKSRAAGVRIGDRVTSIGTVTVWCAGRTTAITTTGYDTTWTGTAALSVGIGATDIGSDAATTAAAAATTSSIGSGSCRHGTTV